MQDSQGVEVLHQHRKTGWTWAKEIIGTMIGVLAIVVPIATAFTIWFLSWSRTVDTTQALHSADIRYLKEARTNTDAKLDRILNEITEIRVNAAAIRGAVTGTK